MNVGPIFGGGGRRGLYVERREQYQCDGLIEEGGGDALIMM